MPQSILKADAEAEKTCYVRSYLRRPDAAFWLDLLAPPPTPNRFYSSQTHDALFARCRLGLECILCGFIKIAVKPRPSGRGCKAVTRKPPQGACLVSLTELGLERLFAKKED